nr:MAG TPA: hypothetical protein [Caudoviricetes sp.]
MEITQLNPKQKLIFDELMKKKLTIMSDLFVTGSIEYEKSKKELAQIEQKIDLLLKGEYTNE